MRTDLGVTTKYARSDSASARLFEQATRVLPGGNSAQSLFLSETIAGAYGTGAAAGAAGVGGIAFAGGLAFLGGYEIGGAINDLILNNRRLFAGGNPIENFIFDHFVLPRIKGSFGRGR